MGLIRAAAILDIDNRFQTAVMLLVKKKKNDHAAPVARIFINFSSVFVKKIRSFIRNDEVD